MKIICHPDNLQDPQYRVLTTSKAVKLNLRLVGSTGQCAAALALPIRYSRDLSVRFDLIISSLQDKLSTLSIIKISNFHFPVDFLLLAKICHHIDATIQLL